MKLAAAIVVLLALFAGGFFDGHRASAAPDRTPPTVPGNLRQVGSGSNSISVAWDASTDNKAVTGYDKIRDGFQVADQTNVLTYTFAPAIWACGQSHQIQIKAFDAAGNRSSPATGTFNTATCPDTIAPSAPGNPHESDDSSTTATVVWDASTDNVGVTGYKVNGSDVGNVLLYQFSGLTCGQSVPVSIVAYDAAGNESATATTTVSAEACNTPPSQPGNLHQTGSTDIQITVAWDASTDDSGVVGYYKERDGTRVSDADSDLSYTFQQAAWACDQTHVIRVIAYDAQGLESVAAQINATTADCASSSSQVYVGARIDGGFLNANYGTGTSTDYPFGGSEPNLSVFESHYGRQLSFVHWGGPGAANNWPDVADFNAAAAQRAWDAGMFSMYGFGLPVAGMNALISNSPEAQSEIGLLADQMAAWGKPILFRPLWEMNGAWFEWGSANFTPSQYVTAWNNLHAIFDAHGATNVSWAWVPNTCSGTVTCSANDQVPDPSPWYPSGQYAPDWTGFEGYVKTGYMTPTERYSPTYNVLVGLAPGKPMVIGEWGIRAGLSSPGKHQFFLDMLGDWLPSHPQVKAFSYFNDDGDTPDVQIEEGDSIGELNSEALDAWQTGIASTCYISNAASTFPTSGKVPVPGAC